MLAKLQNIVYDTNYTAVIPGGGFVVVLAEPSSLAPEKKKKADAFGRMDSLLQKIGLAPTRKKA